MSHRPTTPVATNFALPLLRLEEDLEPACATCDAARLALSPPVPASPPPSPVARKNWSRSLVALALALATVALSSGCATPAQTAGLAAGITVAGGGIPGHEIEQVYYLGVFDPQDQVPPSVYRVTVHGQASVLGLTKFASGWVPAEVVDSLNTSIGYNKDGKLEITRDDTTQSSSGFQTGRRLILFGPEGFREAPRNHRLVIVMGTDPSRYFGTVSEIFNQMSQGSLQKRNDAIVNKLLLALTKVQGERDRLNEVQDQINSLR